MTIWQKELDHQIWLVGAKGRLDQMLTPELEKTLNALLSAHQFRLIIDLSQAIYINSGGLRCLVTAWRRTRQQQGNLILFGLTPRLHEIFAMVGFDQVFIIVPTQQQAVAQLMTND
ncbi:MAG: STAS domain-containing protein [Anaerolineales bacterium]|nr:STAS domain-containing protein [Anaerolineales bacterium]